MPNISQIANTLLRRVSMSPIKLTFSILDDAFTIHRLPPDHAIPEQIHKSCVYSITKTLEELSVICTSSIPVDSDICETGWSCLKVLGPLDFSLTGILANVSAILANEKISIFAISTYDTDYILIRSDTLSLAKKALKSSGHIFID